MSTPILKNIDKSINGIFNDDFDSKYTLQIKTPGPCGVVFTTHTTFDDKEKKLDGKVSAKYAHSSGFTLDKIEVSPKGKVATETSLVNAAPGLKLEFKGNDTDKGDLSFTYSRKAATLTGEVDALNFSKASSSLALAHGPFVGGASVDVGFAKSNVESTKFGLGLTYTAPNSLFTSFRINNCKEFSGLFSYGLSNELTLAGKFVYSTAKKSVASTVAGVYKFNPSTLLKIKTSSEGTVNASVKKDFEKKFSVVGSVEVPNGLSSGFKFGVNATLG